MSWWQRMRNHPRFIRFFNWEYWSFNTVYGPIYLIFVLLGVRARSFFFFSASNPTIENGGFLNESKKKIYDIMPPEYYPETLFFPKGTTGEEVVNQVKASGIDFPLIAKPDIGGRGRGVKKIDSAEELVAYASGATLDFLVQDFIPYELEAGIFYYRMPGAENGYISGIVFKEFLTVKGNGKDNVESLLQQDPRHILQLPVLARQLGDQLKYIPANGEKLELVPYGNHARGAKFTDHSFRADAQLTDTFNRICNRINGFYYGRMDVRFESWEKLAKGEAFSIIELNGAGSEPTHMYDPEHSIFFAWKEIIRHWILLWKISRANHKKGIPYMRFSEGMAMFREDKRISKLLEEMG
ncbi:hypothetical protein [Parasegetibacter sp. NRK P23]|uniref:hypothetical protein n=1 Tax=Parasegetibacter sp. NRK P23 TaxID=2942999 RepID=UPI0020434775|nr:hypothetical protein [Parasegetibacter sp. NRK P23]MCM5528188.1 hypothetical protein [Parasegetibacter sp. NRK P23]